MKPMTINNLHLRLCMTSLISAFAGIVTVIFCISGITVIALRVNNHPRSSLWLWSLLALIVVALALTALIKKGSLPNRAQVVAMIDCHGRCGGLQMAAGISGCELWQPTVVPGTITVSWSNPPLLITLLGSCAFLLAALYIPMPKAFQQQGVLQLGSALARIEEQIDTLEALDMLEEQRAELFRKELESIEKEQSAENPAATWETIDKLIETIAAKANEEIENLQNQLIQQTAITEMADAVVEMWEQAGTESDDIAALAAAELAQLLSSHALSPQLSSLMRQLMPNITNTNALTAANFSKEDLKKFSEALSSLSAEEMSKLRELMEKGMMNSAQMQACENARLLTAEELREMLRQQCSGSACKSGGTNLLACVAASLSSGAGAAYGAGEPGSGGISRGPGHAPLSFSGNTEEHDFLFKLQALPKGSPQFKNHKLVGISATAPQITVDNVTSSGGSLSSRNPAGAAALTTPLLPQHRGVVKNYFSRKITSKPETEN